MKIVTTTIEFGHSSTRHLGVQITVGERQPVKFVGPRFGPGEPVGTWVHAAITWLIDGKLLEESERGGLVTKVKDALTQAGFTWGDDHECCDREVSAVARERQSN